MILVLYPDGRLEQSTSYNDAGIEAVFEAGATVVRFDWNFHTFQQYAGNSLWSQSVPWGQVLGDRDP